MQSFRLTPIRQAKFYFQPQETVFGGEASSLFELCSEGSVSGNVVTISPTANPIMFRAYIV